MRYLGDYVEDDTVYACFNTRQADGTPITLGGTPAVSVYKDGGVTESTAGVTLTTDFDSRTGLHLVTIDTSADAFYATGADYSIVITTGTVDSVSVVGTEVACFSIQNRYSTAGSGLDAAGVRAAVGLASANLDTQLSAIVADTNELQTDITDGGRVDLLIDAIKAKTDNLPAAPAATGDIPSAAAIADAVCDEALSGHTTAGTVGKALSDAATNSAATVLQTTTIATLTSQTVFTLTAGSADNDAYNGLTAIITDQSTSTQKAVASISDYVGSTRTMTLAGSPAFTIATGDTVVIAAVPNTVTPLWLPTVVRHIVARSSSLIEIPQGDYGYDIDLSIDDANGSPVDLTSKTLRFIVETEADAADVGVVNATGTATGCTFQASSAMTLTAGATYRFAVKETLPAAAGYRTHAFGQWTVLAAAVEDAP